MLIPVARPSMGSPRNISTVSTNTLMAQLSRGSFTPKVLEWEFGLYQPVICCLVHLCLGVSFDVGSARWDEIRRKTFGRSAGVSTGESVNFTSRGALAKGVRVACSFSLAAAGHRVEARLEGWAENNLRHFPEPPLFGGMRSELALVTALSRNSHDHGAASGLRLSFWGAFTPQARCSR